MPYSANIMERSKYFSLNTLTRSPSRIVPPFCATLCSGIDTITGCTVAASNSWLFASAISHTSLRVTPAHRTHRA